MSLNYYDIQATMLQKNQWTKDLNPVQQAAIGWDVSSLDYAAKGIEGWKNRAIGLTSIINPKAWADTWAGVIRNNSFKNKDANFLEAAWNNILGVGGGALMGGFYGISLPLPIVKGAALTIGSALDEITDGITGKGDKDTFIDKVNKSWDLSLIDDWNFESTGRGNIGIGDILANQIGDAISLFTTNMNKEELKTLGLQFVDSSFDIFDPNQKTDIQSHILNIPQQIVNFVGEWMLDLTTFVPGGAIAKGTRTMLKGVAGSTVDKLRLEKAFVGEQTVYSPLLRELADGDEVFAFNTLAALGVNSKKINLMAHFLGKAKTEAEVAEVFLAVEYQKKEALISLFNKLAPEEKHWALSIDNLSQGGTYARTLRRGDLADEVLLDDTQFTNLYIEALDSLIDSARLSDDAALTVGKDEAQNLLNLVSDLKKGDKTTERVMTVGNIRDYGLRTNAFGRTALRWKSKLLEEDSFLRKVQYETDIPGLPTIIRLIRKAPMISYKGLYDVNNRVVTTQKALAKLDEIDGLSEGSFRASGKLDELVQKLMQASDNNSIIKILDEIEQAGLTVVGTRHGIKDPTKLQAFVDNMLRVNQTNADKLHNTTFFARKYHDPKENVVYVGDVAKGVDTTTDAAIINGNRYYGIDLKALSNSIYRDGTKLESLMDLSISAKHLLNNTMVLWMKAILTRPARFPRERLANLPGILLSGTIYDMFFSTKARDAIYNSFMNAPFRMRRAIDNVNLKKELTGSYTGSVEKYMRNLNRDYEETNKAIQEVMELEAAVNKQNEIAASYGFRTREEQDVHIQNKVEEKKETVWYDPADPKIIYATAAEARAAIRNRTRGSEFRGLKSFDEPVEVQKVGETLVNNTSAIKANEEAARSAKVALDNTKPENIPNLKQAAKDYDVANPMLNKEEFKAEFSAKTLVSRRQKEIFEKYKDTADFMTLADMLIRAQKNNDTRLVAEIQAKINERKQKVIDSLTPEQKKVIENSSTVQKVNKENSELALKNNELETVQQSQKQSPTIKAIDDEFGESLRNGNKVLWIRNANGSWKKVTDWEAWKNATGPLTGKQYKITGASWNPPSSTVGKGTRYGREVSIEEVSDEVLAELNMSRADFEDRFRKGANNADECGRGVGEIWPALAAAGIGSVSYIDNLGRAAREGSTEYLEHVNDLAPQKAFDNERASYEKLQEQSATAQPEEFSHKEVWTKEDSDAYEVLKEIAQLKSSANTDGYAQWLKESKNRIAKLKARRDSLQKRRNDLVNYIERDRGPKQPRIGEGKSVYREQVYENYSEGESGRYAEAALHPGDTWKEVYDLNRMADVVYNNEIGPRLAEMLPGDKDYYDSLASILQLYGRNDEVFMMLASGKSSAEVIDWLKNTSAGKAYARRRNLGKGKDTPAAMKGKTAEEIGFAQTYEEYVANQLTFVNTQLLDETLKKYFLDGQPLTGPAIAELFKGREHLLLPITGRAFDVGEMRKATNLVNNFFDKFNRLVVENPQQFLENVPMARAYYDDRMKQLIDMNIEKYGRDLTVAEINALQDLARKDSERHVRKWLYNVQSKSNFVEAISTVIPFVTAYTYTLKMIAKGIQENPAAILWMLSGLNKMSYSNNWIDSEGNPTDMWNAQSLVMPLDPTVKKLLEGSPFGAWIKGTNEIKLSTRSINVWFGGEVIPGPGPLITLPVSELIKGNPVLANKVNEATKKFMFLIPGSEGLIDYILPMGPSTKPFSYDQLLPTWTNQIADAGLFTQWVNPDYRGQQYIDTFAKVMAHESAKARAFGPNYPLPTEKEIEEKVSALYGLKFLSAFFGPVSYQVRGEADIARSEYNKYRKAYGEDADWMFLTDHPELISGMVTTNSNRFGLSPDAITVENLKDYPEIVNDILMGDEGSRSMLGFFMNTSGDSDFNDYAYVALQTMTPGVGEATYYDKISPAEVARKAAAKTGWVYFNKLNDAIDAEAIARDVDPEKDLKLKDSKEVAMNALKAKYPEWYAEYMKRDAYQYIDRANTVERLLQNPQFIQNFGNDSFVNSLALFMDTRNQMIELLQDRNEKGGSALITSASNQDIKEAFNKIIFQLKSESNRFSDFYNRFFEGDSLLG
jgi:hypothetical protein